MSVRYVLDTHALVWSVIDPGRLGARARRVIENAARGELAIPSAVIMELGRIIDAGEIDTGSVRPSDLFAGAFAFHGVLPMSLDAAIAAPVLKLPHGDPYDRLIVATALDLGVPLITKDGNITDSGVVRVVW